MLKQHLRGKITQKEFLRSHQQISNRFIVVSCSVLNGLFLLDMFYIMNLFWV